MSGRRVAVLDFGTNSTRLLVADVLEGAVAQVERRSTVTRLGEGLEQTGRLSDAATARVVQAAAEYREVIDTFEADAIVAVATSAVRDANNSEELLGALRGRLGVDAQVISGDQEARLTFLGATAERDGADGEIVVIDIGGGSTEYVVGSAGGTPSFSVSTRMGSVRHTERHLHDDPPGLAELTALRSDARSVVSAEVPAALQMRIEIAIAVAGTATSLAAIELERRGRDSRQVHGLRLSLADCENVLARLARLPEAERRLVRGLDPDRAPTIVAGVAILLESLRACELDEVEVSDHDILHGAAISVAEGTEIGDAGAGKPR